MLAFRKKDWRAFCAAAGDSEETVGARVSYNAERLLEGVAAAVRDACRLKRQLEETLGFGSTAAAAGEQVNVEEPAEAPLPLLDSAEFAALMEALNCSKTKGDTSWCLRTDRPYEYLVAMVDRLELLTSRSLQVCCCCCCCS